MITLLSPKSQCNTHHHWTLKIFLPFSCVSDSSQNSSYSTKQSPTFNGVASHDVVTAVKLLKPPRPKQSTKGLKNELGIRTIRRIMQTDLGGSLARRTQVAIVGSLLCSERVFSAYAGLPIFSKPNPLFEMSLYIEIKSIKPNQINCWFLVGGTRRREFTNSTHLRRRLRELKPGTHTNISTKDKNFTKKSWRRLVKQSSVKRTCVLSNFCFGQCHHDKG